MAPFLGAHCRRNNAQPASDAEHAAYELPLGAQLFRRPLEQDFALGQHNMPSCVCRKSNPDILVVQPAENWAAKNVPGPLDGAQDRRILLQG